MPVVLVGGCWVLHSSEVDAGGYPGLAGLQTHENATYLPSEGAGSRHGCDKVGSGGYAAKSP